MTAGYYRVEFEDKQRSYYSGFQDGSRSMYPAIRKIIEAAGHHGVRDIWWFFEPYAEVTWYAGDTKFISVVYDILQDAKIKIVRWFHPGDFEPNWFGKTQKEIDASRETYGQIRKVAQSLLENERTFEEGMSVDSHYQRSLHVLANQVGMNYLDEGFACFKHGLICLGFFFSNPHAIAALLRKFKIKTGLTIV